MNAIVAWFAENRVAANMMMILILVLGYLSADRSQKEAIPATSLTFIAVKIIYPGASPSEVEQAVCIKAENAINGLKGVSRQVVISNQDICDINVHTEEGADVPKVAEAIKAALDNVKNFPTNILKPQVNQTETPNDVGNIMIAGDADHRTLRALAEKVQDDLADYGLTKITVVGARTPEIAIEISESTLQEYNLTFAEISRAIKSNSQKSSGGTVESDDSDTITIAAGSKASTVQDYENIVLRASANSDGGQIKLSDVAKITDSFAKEEQQAS